MDGRRFDDLARGLGISGSRRSLTAALLAALVGLAFGRRRAVGIPSTETLPPACRIKCRARERNCRDRCSDCAKVGAACRDRCGSSGDPGSCRDHCDDQRRNCAAARGRCAKKCDEEGAACKIRCACRRPPCLPGAGLPARRAAPFP